MQNENFWYISLLSGLQSSDPEGIVKGRVKTVANTQSHFFKGSYDD